MIPITELRYFADTQPAYRILKPWWDVFTDYISIPGTSSEQHCVLKS
uniref:LRRC8 pannexin-like TM region domain-containing protein n=1 Tax=Sinocyclocheilus anshuiensis TaxID=1608454 RepID=A0A671QJY5_9TELE